MEGSKQQGMVWADQPYRMIKTPGHAAGEVTSGLTVPNTMALAHNLFLRALNSVVLQADAISKPEDIADLFMFCEIWIYNVENHHKLEEEMLFPQLEKLTGVPGFMSSNVEQHKAFHDGVEEFRKYITTTSPSEYNSKTLLDIIESFGPAFEQHLRDEIDTLIGVLKYDPEGKEMHRIFTEVEKAAFNHLTMEGTIPFVLGCGSDDEFEGGTKFPVVPFWMPYATDWMFARKHRGVWRFCPTDFYGRRRPLQFLAAQE